MIFNGSTCLGFPLFHVIYQPVMCEEVKYSHCCPPLALTPNICIPSKVSEETQAWTWGRTWWLGREENIICYRKSPTYGCVRPWFNEGCCFSPCYEAGFLLVLSWGCWGEFSCRCYHTEVQGCILLCLLLKVTLHPHCRWEVEHDSGILHQLVLSTPLSKAVFSVAGAFEHVHNESRIEMVQQGRPGRYLAHIQHLTPLHSAGKRNMCCGSAVKPPGSPLAQQLPPSHPPKKKLGEEQDSWMIRRHQDER